MASMVERMIGAARLDPMAYEEVEHDLDATGQAALVVVIAAVAGAIGEVLGSRHGAAVAGAIFSAIGALLFWVIWAAIIYFVGKTFFATAKTEVSLGQMLRTLGFAQSPGVLTIFGFIPILGVVIRVVVAIWVLIAGIIAIRQAMDFGTGRAIATALISAIIPAIVFSFFIAFGAILFAVAVH